jgi:cyclopropane fatty-acyl-phospholipid synthase-like methyltransferase
MTDYSSSINQQYGRENLITRILEAFRLAGIDVEALTLADLSSFDQLHTGGRRATRILGELAGIEPGMQILDIGCGVGGPARTLAADFGCNVIGIDITKDYVLAAEMLTERVGLSKQVTFIEGDALDLQFDDGAFDAVLSQNAIMNIEDKHRLFKEVHRVLRPGGILALEAIMQGVMEATSYPVYWADDPSVSFVETPEKFRQIIKESGFTELAWLDVTQNTIALIHKVQASSKNDKHPLGLHLLYTNVPAKTRNTLQGYVDGIYVDIYAAFKRSD